MYGRYRNSVGAPRSYSDPPWATDFDRATTISGNYNNNRHGNTRNSNTNNRNSNGSTRDAGYRQPRLGRGDNVERPRHTSYRTY
ncbi:hypothetical protein ElyMa_001825900, partial [Elysia marginata]